MTDQAKGSVTRRRFAQTTAMAALSAAIVPSRVLGAQAPSNKLNIAAIGIGGMGPPISRPAKARTSSRSATWTATTRRRPSRSTRRPTFYTDYRAMLEKQKDIDARRSSRRRTTPTP